MSGVQEIGTTLCFSEALKVVIDDKKYVKLAGMVDNHFMYASNTETVCSSEHRMPINVTNAMFNSKFVMHYPTPIEVLLVLHCTNAFLIVEHGFYITLVRLDDTGQAIFDTCNTLSGDIDTIVIMPDDFGEKELNIVLGTTKGAKFIRVDNAVSAYALFADALIADRDAK